MCIRDRLQIQKDGVGLIGTNLQVIVPYETTWRKVKSMSKSNGNLFISHCQGISKIGLESCQSRLVLALDDQPCVLTSFGTEILYTNLKKASVWQLNGDSGNLRLFAGSENEDGRGDGPLKPSRFKHPVGICTEFGSVVYVCNAQTNSLKICTKLKECAQFLEAIGCLYEAFSVHNKGAHYTVKSIVEAIGLVKQCRDMLDENTSDIQGATSIKTTLTGPQGHVSARTVASVAMMDTGLQRLYANLGKFNYRHTNLLSCMTLDVENCHSTVHHKQGNISMAEYYRSFGVVICAQLTAMHSGTEHPPMVLL